MAEIVETEGVLGGKPRVEGTRVSARQIYEMHTERGMSVEEIEDVLPTVDAEGVRAALEFMEGREDPGSGCRGLETTVEVRYEDQI